MNKDYIENFDDFSDKEEIKLISTKANTLKVLEERITKAKVEPMLIIIARDYRMKARWQTKSVRLSKAKR